MHNKQAYRDLYQQIRQNDYSALLDCIRSGGIKADELIENPEGIKFRLIQAAIEANNLLAVRELIKLGANVNKRSGGKTPLFSAAAQGLTDVVKLLMKSGADVNQTSSSEEESNQTPLMAAVKNPEIVRLLLAAGADPHSKDNDGQTAIYQATLCGNEETMELLLAAKCAVDANCLFGPVERRQLQIVQKMLALNPDLNKPAAEVYGRFLEGEMLLTVAVRINAIDHADRSTRANRLGVIQALLDAGANVNVREVFTGKTPLLIAIEERDVEISRMLVKAGANPKEEVVTKSGQRLVAFNLAERHGIRLN